MASHADALPESLIKRLTSDDQFQGARYEIAEKPEMPALRLTLSASAPAFMVESSQRPDIIYRVEESRGYDYRGSLWSPGYFRANLDAGASTSWSSNLVGAKRS